jgi:hypothetical protein
MRAAVLVRRAAVLLAGVLVVLITSPGAALACGISYEDTPGSPTVDCSATAAVTGITVIGAAAAAMAALLLITNFLGGSMSAGDLAALLDQIPTATGLGDTVTLVDGSQLSLLDAGAQAAMTSYAAQLAGSGRTRPTTWTPSAARRRTPNIATRAAPPASTIRPRSRRACARPPLTIWTTGWTSTSRPSRIRRTRCGYWRLSPMTSASRSSSGTGWSRWKCRDSSASRSRMLP